MHDSVFLQVCTILFNLYVVHVFNARLVSTTVPPTTYHFTLLHQGLIHADQTTLASCTNYSSIGRLEQNLDFLIAEIVEWAASNKLPVIEGKTKAILITGKRLPSKINDEMAFQNHY